MGRWTSRCVGGFWRKRSIKWNIRSFSTRKCEETKPRFNYRGTIWFHQVRRDCRLSILWISFRSEAQFDFGLFRRKYVLLQFLNCNSQAGPVPLSSTSNLYSPFPNNHSSSSEEKNQYEKQHTSSRFHGLSRAFRNSWRKKKDHKATRRKSLVGAAALICFLSLEKKNLNDFYFYVDWYGWICWIDKGKCHKGYKSSNQRYAKQWSLCHSHTGSSSKCQTIIPFRVFELHIYVNNKSSIFFYVFYLHELWLLMQSLKTRVIKKNLNPVWNEKIMLSIPDPIPPLKLVWF